MCFKSVKIITVLLLVSCVSSEYNTSWIFKCNSSIGYVHMATIEVIPNTSPILTVAFQASSAEESTNDQHIIFTSSNDLGQTWSIPQTIAYGERYHDALWGPVLHYDDINKLLWLFYSESGSFDNKTSNKSDVGGNILYKTSSDVGKTWSDYVQLLSYKEFGITNKVTANKLIVIDVPDSNNNSIYYKRWILPYWQEAIASNSTGLNCSSVLITDNFGKTWNSYGKITNPGPGTKLIENTVASIKNSNGMDTGTILQLFRAGKPNLFMAFSDDYGISWQNAYNSTIPNPNSKVFVFTDIFNQQILSYNPSTSKRYPLDLAKSINGGKTFKSFVEIDGTENEEEYPTSVQVVTSMDSNVLIFTVYSASTHTGIKMATSVLTP
eukprot:522890_1